MEITAKKIMRSFTGRVISVSNSKTITVQVDSLKLNKKYQKQYRTSKKYHVHDEKNLAKSGDRVAFVECRPLSKTKRWRLVQIINKIPPQRDPARGGTNNQ